MPTPLDYQLAYRFEELGRRLKESATAGPVTTGLATAASWDVPLAFWALPRDRRLPKALLGRSTREIVQTPFAKLYATPGIGTKKLITLIQLLERAVAASREAPTIAPIAPSASPTSTVAAPAAEDFDPANVSESQWNQWRASVKRHALASEPLGRFALTLQDLPSVMWRTPLSDYADLSLEQIRRRKTHGEKRVRAVMRVFALAYSLLGDRPPPHLTVRVVPRFVLPIETWLLDAARGSFPPAGEVRRSFTEPLLKQLRHDAGDAVADLVADRLRDNPAEFNARAVAKKLGLTRARVYQLLAQAAAVMSVRWPEGSSVVRCLREKVQGASLSPSVRFFVSTADLFFPRRGFSSGSAQRELGAERRARDVRAEDKDEDRSAAA